nr:MAG TPA: hypothetical protein [Caudoviricetes sp.]
MTLSASTRPKASYGSTRATTLSKVSTESSTPAGRTSSKRPTRKWTDMRYLVEPVLVTELKEGDIIYYTPRFEKTTASSMCPNDEKFTRVIEIVPTD